MAAAAEEVLVASDVEEQTRVMDGHILRQEIWTSAALAIKVTRTYNDAGGVVDTVCEDI